MCINITLIFQNSAPTNSLGRKKQFAQSCGRSFEHQQQWSRCQKTRFSDFRVTMAKAFLGDLVLIMFPLFRKPVALHMMVSKLQFQNVFLKFGNTKKCSVCIEEIMQKLNFESCKQVKQKQKGRGNQASESAQSKVVIRFCKDFFPLQ